MEQDRQFVRRRKQVQKVRTKQEGGRRSGKRIGKRLIWQQDVSKYSWSIEQAKKKGKPLESYPWHGLVSNPPPILGTDAALMKAYYRLSTHRPESMGGIMAIPYGAIADYADRQGWSQEFKEGFADIIMAADAIFTSHIRNGKEEPKQGNPVTNKRKAHMEKLKKEAENGDNVAN